MCRTRDQLRRTGTRTGGVGDVVGGGWRLPATDGFTAQDRRTHAHTPVDHLESVAFLTHSDGRRTRRIPFDGRYQRADPRRPTVRGVHKTRVRAVHDGFLDRGGAAVRRGPVCRNAAAGSPVGPVPSRPQLPRRKIAPTTTAAHGANPTGAPRGRRRCGGGQKKL